MKPANQKHVMVTCYDATFARLIEQTGSFDSILVGDSLGNVIQGHSSTLSVTMEQMLYHVEAVRRGLSKSSPLILIADMPVGSYLTPAMALENAQAFIEAGATMVKVEGAVTPVVRALVDRGLQVCGHVGLTPQTIQDYKVQGKDRMEAERIFDEALSLDAAGVELLVLEMIPSQLAEKITHGVRATTIGIGAGVHCGGQVLVLYDLLGLNPDFNPRFLKKFMPGAQLVKKALQDYSNEVRSSQFPGGRHSFSTSEPAVPEKSMDLR